jgi:hypothetical protein
MKYFIQDLETRKIYDFATEIAWNAMKKELKRWRAWIET